MACGKPAPHPTLRCGSCEEHPLPLTQIRSATIFEGPVPSLLRDLKYHGYFALAAPLAELMADAWPRWETPFDLVVPIPLHPRREQERGFNQSALLVEQLCRRFNWTAAPQALRRVRLTRPQVGLEAAERRVNLKQAFTAVPHLITGRRVLLVDDVCTTGATLAVAAQALLDAGATAVAAYCVARAQVNQDLGYQ